MRSIVSGICASLLVTIVGCGGDAVDAIIREEKAILEAIKSGQNIDKDRQANLAKRLANLTPAQKEEYAKRRVAELGAAAQEARKAMQEKIDANLQKIKLSPGNVEVPKLP